MVCQFIQSSQHSNCVRNIPIPCKRAVQSRLLQQGALYVRQNSCPFLGNCPCKGQERCGKTPFVTKRDQEVRNSLRNGCQDAVFSEKICG
jgi:hypothetical protein